MLFVKHPDLLEKLISALLGIPLESIEQFRGFGRKSGRVSG